MYIVECNRRGLITELCNHHIHNVMNEMEDRIDESIRERLGGEEIDIKVTPLQIKDYIIGMSHAIEATLSAVPADSTIVEIAPILNLKLGNVNNPHSREFAKIMLLANCVRIIVTDPVDVIKNLFEIVESDFDVFANESEYESLYQY